MKLKGINVLEQHVEKMVLGLAVLVAGGFAAMQFVTNPNAVNFDNTTYKPSRVDAAMQQRVNSLKAQLDSDRSIDFDPGEPLSAWFKEEHSNAYGSGTRLAQAIVRPTPLKLGADATIQSSIGLYAEFNPPAPKDLTVLARPYTLSDDVLKDNPNLKPYLPAEPPYDIGAVHIFGEINGRALQQSLLTVAEKDRNAIPSAWWDRDMAILDVVAERQRRLPDGSWGKTEEVPNIPGETSVRSEIRASSPVSSQVLNKVFTDENKIYQPDFYTLMDGEKWTPELVAKLEPLNEEQQRAVDLMQNAWRRLQTAQQALDRFQSQEQKGRQPGGFDAPGRGGKGGGQMMGEGGGPTGREGQTGSEDREQDRRERMLQTRQDDVSQAQKIYLQQKDKVLELLPNYEQFPDEKPKEEEKSSRGGERGPMSDQESFGEGIGFEGQAIGEGGPTLGKGGGGMMGEGTRDRNVRRRPGSGKTPPLFDDEARKVWVHDIDVVPGAVYRYRMRVDYLNPFYGRADRLAEEQKHLANKMYAGSAYTDWSEPVNVVSTKQFYVIDGTYDDSIESRRATVEVYVYTAGAQRQTNMSLRPGEPIGEMRTFTTKSEDEEGNPVDVSMDVDFSTGAVLLDVIEIEEGQTKRDRKVQVLVALEDGTIVALDPDEQRASDDRNRLKELAAKESKS